MCQQVNTTEERIWKLEDIWKNVHRTLNDSHLENASKEVIRNECIMKEKNGKHRGKKDQTIHRESLIDI